MAKPWFGGLQAMAKNGRRREAQAAAAVLLEDEKRFIDLPRSPFWRGRPG